MTNPYLEQLWCDVKFCFRTSKEGEKWTNGYEKARKLFARLAPCKAFDARMIGTYYEMSFCRLNVETKIQDVPKNFLHYVVVSINHFQNEKNWFEHHGIDAIINNNMALGSDWTFPENQPPEGKNYSSDVYKKLCKHFDCILELKTTKMPFSKLDNIEHHRIIVNSDGDILLEERTTQSCEEDAPYSNLNFGKKTLEEVLGDEAIPAEYHVASDFLTQEAPGCVLVHPKIRL